MYPALLTLAMAGCGAADEARTSMGFDADDPRGPNGSGGLPQNDGPVPGPAVDGGTPPGTVEASFIWIANSDQGTVTKLDTRTLEELGRYRTSPNSRGKPSRTSVASDGSVAVANRGGTSGAPSLEAGVTKFYASVDQCVDTNGNGVIDTSTGRDDIRPWGEDECMAWHRPLGEYWSNRPAAWAPSPSPGVPANFWTAAANEGNCSSARCFFDVLRLDGQTGAVLDVVTVGPLSGTDFLVGAGLGGLGGLLPPDVFGDGPGLIENYGPYGGASDAGGHFWVFNANTTHLVRVDSASLQWRAWEIPMSNGYGITVDSKGRVFICGGLGVARFDLSDESWATSSDGPALGFNGCMTDGRGTLWVGGGADSGTPGLHAYDTDTLGFIQSHSVGTVKGVSVDVDGFVWGVSSPGAAGAVGGGNIGGPAANSAFKLDPATGLWETYSQLTGPYSYSDMTGFGLRQAGVITPI